MKKLMFMTAMVLVLCNGAAATECFNAKGNALVPHVRSYYADSTAFQSTAFSVSNITGSSVVCKVTVYDHDGNDVTSYGGVYSGSSNSGTSTVVAQGTGTFNIPANSTRVYRFEHKSPSAIYGYATIEWTSSDAQLRKAIIAGTRITGLVYGDSYFTSQGSVNNGEPF